MDINEIFDTRKLPIDLTALKAFAAFPDELIQLIKNYEIENIKTKDLKIYIPDQSDFIYLSNFFDIENIIKTNFHFYNVDIDNVLIENRLYFIAKTSSAIFICIGTSKDTYGHVFLYGWDLGLKHIANSLENFLNSLM